MTEADVRHRIRAWLTDLAEHARVDPASGAPSMLIGGLQALGLAGVLETAELRAWREELGDLAGLAGGQSGGGTATSKMPGEDTSRDAALQWSRGQPPVLPPPRGHFTGKAFRRSIQVNWSPDPTVVVASLDFYEDGFVVGGHSRREPGFVDVAAFDESGRPYGRAGGGAYLVGAIKRWEVVFAPAVSLDARAVIVEVDGRRHTSPIPGGSESE